MVGTTSNPNIHSSPPWQIRTVFGAFILGFFITPLCIVTVVSHLHVHNPLTKNLVATLGSYIMWLLIFGFLRHQYGPEAYKLMGAVRNRPWAYYWFTGIVFGIVILMLGWVVGLISQYKLGPMVQPYAELPQNDLKWIALMAVLLAPVMEELIFRGFLQSTLSKYLPPVLAVILTALVFTGFHIFYYGNWTALLYVCSLGLVLGYVRQYTGSVIPGMIGHFLNNLIAASALLSINSPYHG